MFFSCSSNPELSCFFGIQTMLELYIYLSPCHRIIFEYEVIAWGWKPVRFTHSSANRTAALCFWHCWFAGSLHDIMGQFLLGFLSNYAPPYLCHSICEIDFNTIEPAFLAQSASGYFLLAHVGSGPKYRFRLKMQSAFRPSWPGDFVGDIRLDLCQATHPRWRGSETRELHAPANRPCDNHVLSFRVPWQYSGTPPSVAIERGKIWEISALGLARYFQTKPLRQVQFRRNLPRRTSAKFLQWRCWVTWPSGPGTPRSRQSEGSYNTARTQAFQAWSWRVAAQIGWDGEPGTPLDQRTKAAGRFGHCSKLARMNFGQKDCERFSSIGIISQYYSYHIYIYIISHCDSRGYHWPHPISPSQGTLPRQQSMHGCMAPVPAVPGWRWTPNSWSVGSLEPTALRRGEAAASWEGKKWRDGATGRHGAMKQWPQKWP